MHPRHGGGYDIGGVTIANAVRLEAASQPGELLVDLATFDALTPELRLELQPDEKISGKRDEVFRARRIVLTPPPEDLRSRPPLRKPASGDRRRILEMFEKLYPESQLETLMYLLEIPLNCRPAVALNFGARRDEVLKWATSPAGVGLPRLESELRYLLNKDETA